MTTFLTHKTLPTSWVLMTNENIIIAIISIAAGSDITEKILSALSAYFLTENVTLADTYIIKEDTYTLNIVAICTNENGVNTEEHCNLYLTTVY